MGSFYSNLYRIYFILKKSAAEGVLRRWPGTGHGLDRLKRLAQRHFLGKQTRQSAFRNHMLLIKFP